MNTDLAAYRGLYVKTAGKYLEEVFEALNILAKNHTHTESLETVHRVAHSLKGQSKTMGYDQAAELCKKVETMFAMYVKKGSVEKDVLGDVEGFFQEFKKHLHSVKHEEKEYDLSSAIVKVSHYKT